MVYLHFPASLEIVKMFPVAENQLPTIEEDVLNQMVHAL
jgi:hypothetical protein